MTEENRASELVALEAHRALSKLANWRAVYAGWQLGTRGSDDPECQAVRDHREATLMHRAELNALLRLLLQKKVFTPAEWTHTVGEEARCLDRMLEEKFVGFETTEAGVRLDRRAADTMQGWKP